MPLQKYQSKLVETRADGFYYEFTQVEGKEDWGLLDTAFQEFIRHPILLALERGRPIIKMSKTAIPNNLVAVTVKKVQDENKIIFSLKGSVFKNKLIPIDTIKDGVDFLLIDESTALLLETITANRIGTILAIWYIVDWLNGLPVTINYEDYIPSCVNCMMNTENLYKYYKLYDLQVRTYIENNEGCVCKQNGFEKGVGCNKFFIRNTYPDLGEISEIIKDFL